MSLYVLKFGGTSVGTLARIQAVAETVIAMKQRGHDVVVVVSAMSGETDRLLNLAREVSSKPDARECDALVATGEQASAALVSMQLIAKGCLASSFGGDQIKIITDENHQKARIRHIDTTALFAEIAAGVVPVVTGFQGVTEDGHRTTLGRGGSDLTAVAVAAALKADECFIYTDVEGVYTTDPRVVPEARLLDKITFEEMLELSSSGAKVLQIRSVEFARRYNVPLRVLSSFKEGPGTLITYEEAGMEDSLVSGIAFDPKQAKLTLSGIPAQHGLASYILGAISDAGIQVDVILQNVPSLDNLVDFSFTVSRADYEEAFEIAKKMAQQLNARDVVGNNRIAKLTLVGVGMRTHAGVASTMFRALGHEGIPIQMISTSEIKISTIIDEKYLELGARVLHAAFGLEFNATLPS